MKTKSILFFVMILFTANLMAQTEKPVKESEKVVVGGKATTTTVKSVQTTQPLHANTTDLNKPTTKPIDKQMHAEKRSNGHAFSGKGNGKKHNLIDPQPKPIHLKKNMQGINKE